MKTTIVAILAAAAVACYSGWRQDARTALDVATTACILAQPFTREASEVAAACNVADDLAPVLRDLLAAKKAARRAGYVHNADEACP